MKILDVPEDFIQFVWKFQLFDATQLELNDGSKIQVVHPGNQNAAGGPDFFNAKIYIGDTLWVGNVEIHHHTLQWQQHKHHEDSAYDNLILHVVLYGKTNPIYLKNGRSVDTISLENRIFNNTLLKYKRLQSQEKAFIPCQAMIGELTHFDFIQFFEPLLIQRLERKVKDIEDDLAFSGGDLDMAFIQSLFKYFGAPINKDMFSLLARSFTLIQLKKQSISITQLESFLFGLADLLHEQDEYASRLESEFVYTKRLFRMEVFCAHAHWQFAGTRPPNFPTLRIAQLAALLYNNTSLFAACKDICDLKAVKALFVIELSSYWKSHYNFGKASAKGTKNLSNSFIDKLIINVIVPFLFFYGQYIGEEKYKVKALRFLAEIAREKNEIVKNFMQLGAPCESAFDSQALIELKTTYCQQYKCLECRLGFCLLKAENP